MKYNIKRLSDGKYLSKFSNFVSYETMEWTDSDENIPSFHGGFCVSFNRRFSNLDEFEIIEVNLF
jgi:hypothetical protein